MRRLNWAFITLLVSALAVGAGIVMVACSYAPRPLTAVWVGGVHASTVAASTSQRLTSRL